MVLGYQDETGHEILELCLKWVFKYFVYFFHKLFRFLLFFSFQKDLVSTYKLDHWSYNGGPLLTRVLEKQVFHTTLAEMTPEKYHCFKVFPKEEFYPINYEIWKKKFYSQYTKSVLENVTKSSVVHVWNKL